MVAYSLSKPNGMVAYSSSASEGMVVCGSLESESMVTYGLLEYKGMITGVGRSIDCKRDELCCSSTFCFYFFL